MSKHTPGPWTVTYTTPSGFPLRIETAENLPVHIAEMVTVNNNLYDDACLIAAAPELLKALKEMVELFESEIHNEYDGTSMLDKRLAEADFARAAIAKATGSES